ASRGGRRASACADRAAVARRNEDNARSWWELTLHPSLVCAAFQQRMRGDADVRARGLHVAVERDLDVVDATHAGEHQLLQQRGVDDVLAERPSAAVVAADQRMEVRRQRE